MKRTLNLIPLIALTFCLIVAPITAQEEAPTSAPDAVAEVVAEAITTASAGRDALVSVALLVVSVIAVTAVIQLQRSIPPTFAGIYFNAAATGFNGLQTLIDHLEKRANETSATWDDEILALVQKLTDEQKARLLEEARKAGVDLQPKDPKN